MPVRWRIVLGIAAVWASLYALAAVAGDFAFVQPPHDAGRVAEPAQVPPVLHWASAVNAAVVFVVLTAIVGRQPALRAGDKVGWIVAMMFLFPLVVPPLWYIHVWRRPA